MQFLCSVHCLLFSYVQFRFLVLILPGIFCLLGYHSSPVSYHSGCCSFQIAICSVAWGRWLRLQDMRLLIPWVGCCVLLSSHRSHRPGPLRCVPLLKGMM